MSGGGVAAGLGPFVLLLAGANDWGKDADTPVKKLRRGPDCVWLDPANLKYQPLCVSIGEELHVFGVVKHSTHTLR